MVDRYILVGFTHLVCTAFILKVLSFILPCYLICQYSCVANSLLLLVIAKLTFGFTKRNFLSEKVQSDNRAVLITGCDTGFGNALARRLDSKGFHVFASCQDPTGTGARDLQKDCSKRLLVFGLDVTNDESVKKAVEFVKENLGTSELWTIVNNAGVFRGSSIELTSVEEFKQVMEVNAFGVVRVTKAFLPLLRQSRGRVVNLTSLAGRFAATHYGAYAMSKFAAVAFTDCLRKEMAVWGLKVISIEPEFFQTPMTSVETIAANIDKTFASIEEDVRIDYGEEYLKNFKVFCEYSTSISSPKINKVLNALELAITLEHPDTVYRPSRNILMRMFYSTALILPDVLKDLGFTLYFYIYGFPKPKEADNNL